MANRELSNLKWKLKLVELTSGFVNSGQQQIVYRHCFFDSVNRKCTAAILNDFCLTLWLLLLHPFIFTIHYFFMVLLLSTLLFRIIRH